MGQLTDADLKHLSALRVRQSELENQLDRIDDEIAAVYQDAAARPDPPQPRCPVCDRVTDVVLQPDGTVRCPIQH